MAAPAVRRIEMLGGFRLLLGGQPPARPPSGRQQELIAFLVLHARGAAVPRQRIAGSLWPDSDDSQALTNLRRELHHLREGWPALEALISARSRTLAWRDDTGVIVDVTAFDAAVDRGLGGDRGALDEAARHYTGDLLPDCAAEWIEAERERLRGRAREALGRLVPLLERERADHDAIERGQQLLRLDPFNEDAWCALMRSHARRGHRATALHLYQECAALLKKELGVGPSAATRLSYREILDLDATAPAAPPAPPRNAAYPLVGRSGEWHALENAWQAAAAGRPRLFLIRGEAGIGKTRLAEELVDWCGVQRVAAASARCYAGEGRLAYAPIATWLKSEALGPALARLAPAWTTDVARLHPDVLAARAEVAIPDRQLESWQRLRFFEAVAQAFRTAAPIALVLDDLQWADGDTIEWLQYFLRSAAATPCLVVGTVRTEEEQDNPPLGRLLASLERDDLLTALALGRLDEAATAKLAGEVAEQPLDQAAQVRVFRETEGHPLFIVERGRMEQGEPPEPARRAPSHVQAVVAARLGLLSADARAAAEIAAAVGRDFRFDLLARASDLEEEALVRALDELWRRQIVRAHADELWDFSHDRIREVAYAGMGPARRRLIHRRIAQAMELLFADRFDEVSATIAMHLEYGGQPVRAVTFLERGAAVAAGVSAYEEAIRCLSHALTLIERLPEGRDRDTRELALRSSLSVVLNSSRGYAAPEVEANLARVFALSRDGGGELPVRWLWVAFTMRFMLGDLKGTREAAEQALARSRDDPSCACEAHHAMGGTLSCTGELDGSRAHFDAALAAYHERHPQRSALGSDLGVFAHGWYSHTLWLLGDEAAALRHSDEAVALAGRQDHMFSRTIALAYAALLHQMRGDSGRVLACAQGVVELCDRCGFGYYGDWARALIGWVRSLERPAEGAGMIEAALARLDAGRAQARRPYYLSLLAESYQRLGDRARTAAILDTAIAMALDRGDLWWLPALYLRRSAVAAPETREAFLRRGLDLARAQNSRALERQLLAAAAAASA